MTRPISATDQKMLSVVALETFKDSSNLESFSCVPKDFETGNYKSGLEQYQDIDEFLKERALDYVKQDLLRTFLLVNQQQEIVAFYAICSGNQVVYKAFRKEKPGTPALTKNAPLPSIDLIYFAVDRNWQNQGYGSRLMGEVFDRVARVSKNVGASLFSVNSIYDATGFYTKRGFVSVGDSQSSKYGNSWLAITTREVRNMATQ